jgi:hypothetical protein
MWLSSVRPLPAGSVPSTFLLFLAFAKMTAAHDHDSSKIEAGHTISAEPLDTTLWIHILIQTFAWGVIFPTGMILGVRNP